MMLFTLRKLHLLGLVLIHVAAGTALGALTVIAAGAAIRDRMRAS